jgi:hypothetical protein
MTKSITLSYTSAVAAGSMAVAMVAAAFFIGRHHHPDTAAAWLPVKEPTLAPVTVTLKTALEGVISQVDNAGVVGIHVPADKILPADYKAKVTECMVQASASDLDKSSGQRYLYGGTLLCTFSDTHAPLRATFKGLINGADGKVGVAVDSDDVHELFGHKVKIQVPDTVTLQQLAVRG